MFLSPSHVDPSLDSRSVTFENPTGARGAGGQTYNGRKGRPSTTIPPGETVVLADLDGPGTLRHLWMTFPPAPPETMRALWMEVFYDGAAEPSVSVPCLDFFGMPHGRPVRYASVLTSAQEGRGFNSYLPMPFAQHVRVEVTNSAPTSMLLYYQFDYTLEPAIDDGDGFLHIGFRRENPTMLRRDFVIAEGLAGPGRFVGCNVGVRVLDVGMWYGEGELKVYRDGDTEFPTICGTGLEDYVGSAWGLGTHDDLYAGAPLNVGPEPSAPGRFPAFTPVDFVSFYRWHLVDPIMYASDLRVTIQQIGAMFFARGQEAAMEAYRRTNPPAGAGWRTGDGSGVMAGGGLAERVDDYCATSYVYCRRVQPVPRLDIEAAVADIARLDYEEPDEIEGFLASVS
jgi:hypothetical protein